MAPAVAMSRPQVESASSTESRLATQCISPTTSAHFHVSTYRRARFEMQIYSRSVRVQKEKRGSWGPLAVFSENDPISGRIILNPGCPHNGRLTVSIEGAFTYTPDQSSDLDSTIGHLPDVRRRRHVFLSTSTSIPVSSALEASGGPRSAFREAFAAGLRRRPSASSIGSSASVERSYPFSFDLPKSCRSGEELPPSFSTPSDSEYSTEFFEVEYKVCAAWEANNAEGVFSLEVPILFCPDPDVQSLDEQTSSTSWLEMPLRSDRPIPFRCAVTLPTTVTFPRNSSIPYFVVFTTTPRSRSLAKEIAADATISITLQRQVTVTVNAPFPLTPPQTPPSSGEEGESTRSNLFRCVKNVQPRLRRRAKTLDEILDIQAISSLNTRTIVDKPLPRLPAQTVFSESRNLQNVICIGFSKRPRHPSDNQHLQSPPKSLPDGLHKGKISLSQDMLPCIDWSGLNVKYYLDISVLIGQDDLRARIPVRLY